MHARGRDFVKLSVCLQNVLHVTRLLHNIVSSTSTLKTIIQVLETVFYLYKLTISLILLECGGKKDPHASPELCAGSALS